MNETKPRFLIVILRFLRLLLLTLLSGGGAGTEFRIRAIRVIRGSMKRNVVTPGIRNFIHNHDAAVLCSAVSYFFFLTHSAFGVWPCKLREEFTTDNTDNTDFLNRRERRKRSPDS
jgi:hypothetical protein